MGSTTSQRCGKLYWRIKIMPKYFKNKGVEKMNDKPIDAEIKEIPAEKKTDWKGLGLGLLYGAIIGLVLWLAYSYVLSDQYTDSSPNLPPIEDLTQNNIDLEIATIPYYGEDNINTSKYIQYIQYFERKENLTEYGEVCGGYIVSSAPVRPIVVETITENKTKLFCVTSTFEYSYIYVAEKEYNISFTEQECRESFYRTGKYPNLNTLLDLNMTKKTCIEIEAEEETTVKTKEEGF